MRKQLLLIAVIGSATALTPDLNSVYGQVHSHLYSFVLMDKFEYQARDGVPIGWELTGWYGGDINRVWLKGEGHILLADATSDVEIQLLFGRLVTSFWEVQGGIRTDLADSESGVTERFFGVVGFEGMAPYWLEIEPALAIDSKGRLSGRLAVTRDIRVTQRALLEFSTELNAGVQAIPEYGLGRGVRDMEFGVRLRRELRREVAPYLGVSLDWLTGKTARMTDEIGADTGKVTVVAGIRLWR